MGQPYWGLLIPIILLSALFHSSPSLAAGDVSPLLSVVGEDYSSPNIVDPSLLVGDRLNITVQATNLPPVVDQASGGLEGLDISISYNSSILKADALSFNEPLCSSLEGCLFANLSTSEAFIFAQSKDSPPGTSRLGMIAPGPSHRAAGSGILFKVEFGVVGRGLTRVEIQQDVSGLIGFSNSCGSLLSYAVVSASFDNRPPFAISANPPSLSLSPGQGKSTNVTVVRVNADTSVKLLLSGITPDMAASYTLNPPAGTVSVGIPSFNSNLTINTSSTTPLGKYNLEIVGQKSNILDQSFQYRLNFTLTVSSSPSTLASGAPSATAAHNTQTVQAQTWTAGPPQLPLVAIFNVTATPTVGRAVFFTSTICGGNPPYSLTWGFGDGTTDKGTPIAHVYAAPGTYNVTLTATDANGNRFTSSQTVAVRGESSSSSLPLTVSAGITSTLLLLMVLTIYLRRRPGRLRP